MQVVHSRNLSLPHSSSMSSHLPNHPQKSEAKNRLYSSLETVSEINSERCESSFFFPLHLERFVNLPETAGEEKSLIFFLWKTDSFVFHESSKYEDRAIKSYQVTD